MRSEIADAKRVVVKVGSSSLTGPDGHLDHGRVRELARLLSALHGRGARVVLVTSGAIAAGLLPLGLTRRPRDLETQQAAAAVGQGLLVRHYADAFAEHGVTVAQLLLTVEDVLRPRTYRNALNTISRLFRLGVVPIVNENDTVATHEIRFGDNDKLAALIAHLVRADALLLMSDVDGLYTAHPDTPGARRIDRVDDLTTLDVDTSRVGSKVGTGGMRTKLQAADIATQAGVSVVLGHADDLERALAGDEVGTFFAPVRKRRPRRLLWLAFAAEPRGFLHVDAGARDALLHGKASLLAAGIREVRGVFSEGEPVEMIGPDGHPVGRGFVAYSSADLEHEMGHSSSEAGHRHQRPVVHRDHMMLATD
ncbi:glutamate 5-kinase [Tessaracoccus flavus]|uniref:Glutamate 5-kinase n=1 Tax=Tessaracoccus flavus TaxID=1610493 RepID=A0A1Q2CDK5_9ACTN|nr:glutamate 5-kinase [Tessaracoccus flavus]AQP44198.1 glutamate 5-kinase [Tessaracoccus flavus]SDY37922.1 glutamate 5-kinase [Tessaracoccus flavus]